jgi:hypothetical protein
VRSFWLLEKSLVAARHLLPYIVKEMWHETKKRKKCSISALFVNSEVYICNYNKNVVVPELFVSRHPRASRDNWNIQINRNDQQDIFKKFCKLKCKQAQMDPLTIYLCTIQAESSVSGKYTLSLACTDSGHYLLNHKHMSSDNGVLSGIFEKISSLLRYQIMGVPYHEQEGMLDAER